MFEHVFSAEAVTWWTVGLGLSEIAHDRSLNKQEKAREVERLVLMAIATSLSLGIEGALA